MSEGLFMALLSLIGAIAFIFFIGVILGGGMALICRPLDHQFEWEKKMQGLNTKNKEKEDTLSDD